jgi:serine/threonine protein kinase/tetratricopeptide (TPR) repeat protein
VDILYRFEEVWEQGQWPTIEDYLLPAEDPARLPLLIDLIHVDLERRFRAGRPVRVEHYLERFGELVQEREAVLELIAAEHRLRRRAGEEVAVSTYRERFPQWEAELKGLFETAGTVQSESTQRRLSPGLSPERPPAIPGYEIRSVLGRGGMGVVYKARQTRLGRLVALKIIVGGGHAGCEEKARFRTEAEAVARLQHPNIVQIYEVGDQEGVPFISLEYVAGGSLADRLRGTPLPPREGAQLVETLARAVHYAHEHGVIHRDLKPGNVLLQNANSSEDNSQFAVCNLRFAIPKLADFGLAKKLDDEQGQTRTGAVLGTPSYMAPEQAAGNIKAMGPATDVYALAAILYELVTGRPPFRGPTALDTLEQVRHQEPVPPRQLQPRVPRDLETICLKGLSKEPRQRYGSAQALAEDVACFLAGKPIAARPLPRVQRIWRWCRRRPKDAALLLATACVLGLAGGGGLWIAFERAGRAEDRAARLEAEAQANRARTHAIRGEVLFEKGRLKEAAAEYRRAIELKPDDAEFHRQLGELLYSDDRYDEAIAVLREAARLNPAYAVVHNSLGDAYYQKGLLDPAIAAYREAARLEPDYAEAHFNLGFCLKRQRRLEEAIAEYRQAVRLKPKEGLYHNNLGAALEAGGRPEEALAEYWEAVRLDPDDATYHKNLAALLHLEGQVVQSLGEFREAVRLKPREAMYHVNLGVALHDLARWGEAEAEYREAIRLKPDYANAHWYLGLALLRQGALAEALKVLHRGHQLGAKNRAWYATTAGWLRHNEMIASLEPRLRDILSGAARPADAVEKADFARLCMLKGRFAAAARLYREAFVERPGLAEDLEAAHLYNAACAAALAGGRRGRDAEKLEAGQCRQWRKQALGWLRRNLALRVRPFRADPARHRAVVLEKTSVWLRDSDLAGVRGAEAIGRQPSEERPAWVKFWSDVRSLRRQAWRATLQGTPGQTTKQTGPRGPRRNRNR